MISDATIERAHNEHEQAEPLRVENDNAGAAWLKGYADAFNGRDVNAPRRHVVNYLRGYIQGLKSKSQ